MNQFDSRLPKTTTYWKEDDIFWIKHNNFIVSMDEGKAIAELLMFAGLDKSTKAMIIDNREAKGAWPQDINDLWQFDESQLSQMPQKKVATLTNSVIAAMQINRVSKNNGITHLAKAFYSDVTDEVLAFLNE